MAAGVLYGAFGNHVADVGCVRGVFLFANAVEEFELISTTRKPCYLLSIRIQQRSSYGAFGDHMNPSSTSALGFGLRACLARWPLARRCEYYASSANRHHQQIDQGIVHSNVCGLSFSACCTLN